MTNTRRLLLLLLWVCSYATSRAQPAPPAWQWGMRGGGSFDESSVGGGREEVVDMATDQHGNVYILASGFTDFNDVTVDTTLVQTAGLDMVGNTSIIYSLRCDGSLRWVKYIGKRGGINSAIECDTLGGVYIAVNQTHLSNNMYLYVDTDTMLQEQSYKWNQIVKYDTAGEFQWVWEPQPDSISVWNSPSCGYDLSVDGGGNIYYYAGMTSGGYFGGAMNVTQRGYYVVHLDKDGHYLNNARLDMSVQNPYSASWWSQSGRAWMVRNHQTGMLYIGSYRPFLNDDTTYRMSIGGIPVKDGQGIFMASFSPNGALNWLRGNTDTAYGHALNCGLSKPVIDAAHNLYFTAASNRLDTIAGMPVINDTWAQPVGVSVAMKLDSAGNGKWLINSRNKYSTGGNFCAGALVGNRFMIGHSYSNWMTWPGMADTITKASDGQYQIFIAAFDTATGAFAGIDTLTHTYTMSGGDQILAMITDRNGNLYAGGRFGYNLMVGPDTLYAVSGGDKDFFIAQYGTGNCSAALDTPSTSVWSESLAPGRLRVFPNPAGEVLHLESANNSGAYVIRAADGRVMVRGRFVQGHARVDVRMLPAGIYFVSSAGTTRRFVRQ